MGILFNPFGTLPDRSQLPPTRIVLDNGPEATLESSLYALEFPTREYASRRKFLVEHERVDPN